VTSHQAAQFCPNGAPDLPSWCAPQHRTAWLPLLQIQRFGEEHGLPGARPLLLGGDFNSAAGSSNPIMQCELELATILAADLHTRCRSGEEVEVGYV